MSFYAANNKRTLYLLTISIFCLTGCSLTPLAKHTVAFSSATNVVINSSEDAYRTAIDVHNEEQTSLGVLHFQQGEAWDPRDIKPLINTKGLQARLTILNSLKTYAQSLADITSGLDSPSLDASSASVGSGLSALAAEFPLAGGGTTGLASSSQEAGIASTAARALGEFLASKKIKREVPKVIKTMDPNIQALCNLIKDDVLVIQEQTNRDYDDLIRQQVVFLRQNTKGLSVMEFRGETQRLPVLVMRQQSERHLLQDMQTAIERLALTHHALAADAQGNNPVSLNTRIADLQAAGENLATYYQSIMSK